ncbi:MAG: glycoside hydrolase family 47 protein, partial [Planctomycetaceae bacterium]
LVIKETRIDAIDGLVDLYQTVFDARFLDAAAELADVMIARFGDTEAGGFFYTSDDHEQLIARYKDTQDNATPSGNATAATTLLKLARLTGDATYDDAAVGAVEVLAGQLERHPLSGGQALLAVEFLLGPAEEIVVAGGDAGASRAILALLHRSFRPNKVVAVRPDCRDAELPPRLRELLSGKMPQRGEATLYLCERGLCRTPVSGIDAVRDLLANPTPDP